MPKTFKILALLLLFSTAIHAEAVIKSSVQRDSLSGFDGKMIAVSEIMELPLRVRCGIGFPPFEFINEDGDPDGFNVDIIHAVMDEIGVPYELRLSEWKGVGDSLCAGTIDIVGGMTYSQRRSELVEFGLTHAVLKQMFIVLDGSPYYKAQDLYGKTISLRNGGFSYEFLQRYHLNLSPVICNSTERSLDLLLEGKCDAVLLNDVSFEYIKENYPKYSGLRKINSSLTPSEYRIACSKKYAAMLMPIINEAMYKLRQNGQYEKIYQKWFGRTKSEKMLDQIVWILVGLCLFLFAAIIGVIISQYRITKAKRKINKQSEQIMTQIRHIENNEATLKKIVNMVPVPIFVVDVNDNFKLCFNNRYSEIQLGVTPGMLLEDFITQDTIYLAKNDYLKVLSEGKKTNGQRTLTLKNGTTQYAHVFHEPIEFNGRQCVLSLCMIVTDYKKVEKELRDAKNNAELSEKQKSAFLADMSHEIRNPLNAIMGFAQLLDADYLDADDKAEFGHLIRSSSEQLMNLLNDILDFSKMDADMMELHPTEFDFAQFFNDQSVNYRMQTENAGLEFIRESPYKSCVVKNIDKTRMGQVFTNFFSNALKFTEKGSITVAYRYERGGIYLSVTDTGMGIDKEKQRFLFERYKQLNTTKKGTGLGMAICKQIADLAKGEIGFESTPGEGSCFHLWWPTEAEVEEA